MISLVCPASEVTTSDIPGQDAGLLSDAIKQLKDETMAFFNHVINSAGPPDGEDIDVMEEAAPEDAMPVKGVKRKQGTA
jgi:hypothetical protein